MDHGSVDVTVSVMEPVNSIVALGGTVGVADIVGVDWGVVKACVVGSCGDEVGDGVNVLVSASVEVISFVLVISGVRDML